MPSSKALNRIESAKPAQKITGAIILAAAGCALYFCVVSMPSPRILRENRATSIVETMPDSADTLALRYQRDIEKNDVNDILSLYYVGAADPALNAKLKEFLRPSIQNQLTLGRIVGHHMLALDPNFFDSSDGKQHYASSLPAEGAIQFDYAATSSGQTIPGTITTKIPFGEKNGIFYFVTKHLK